MMEAVIVAVLSPIGTLAGSCLSSRKSAALVAYCLEERTELQEEKIKVANHRIGDLEKERNC